jgi:hypothetical protein
VADEEDVEDEDTEEEDIEDDVVVVGGTLTLELVEVELVVVEVVEDFPRSKMPATAAIIIMTMTIPTIAIVAMARLDIF